MARQGAFLYGRGGQKERGSSAEFVGVPARLVEDFHDGFFSVLAQRLTLAACRPFFYAVSMTERRELCAAIGNKDGEHTRGLGCTRILTHEMFAAGRLEETLAGVIVVADRPARWPPRPSVPSVARTCNLTQEFEF